MKGHKAVKILCLLLAVIIAATSCGTETSDTSVLQYAPERGGPAGGLYLSQGRSLLAHYQGV